jgi:CBS domain-containing protein
MESVMRVSEAMTTDVRRASPEQSIRHAARMMAEIDAGILPVGNDGRLVGVITDRDIAIRGVGLGKNPDTPISEVMSAEVKYCFDDEDIEEVAENMGTIRVRRLPVVNRQKRLVGILSLSDMALQADSDCAALAITGISEPGGEHSQRLDGPG